MPNKSQIRNPLEWERWWRSGSVGRSFWGVGPMYRAMLTWESNSVMVVVVRRYPEMAVYSEEEVPQARNALFETSTVVGGGIWNSAALGCSGESAGDHHVSRSLFARRLRDLGDGLTKELKAYLEAHGASDESASRMAKEVIGAWKRALLSVEIDVESGRQPGLKCMFLHPETGDAHYLITPEALDAFARSDRDQVQITL